MKLETERDVTRPAPGHRTAATEKWDGSRIPDLAGRTVVVTGANSGLGLHTATGLAGAGAHVVMACRDPGRGAAALDRVRQASDQTRVELASLDLADLSSVRRFAEEVVSRHQSLDALVNNAGVMAIPHRRTADGFEMQLGTNHLGHFALTGLLLPALLARPDARVVTVSSAAHRVGRIDFEDLQGERRYSRWGAYAQSKLANLLFAFELHRRCATRGVGLRSVAVHPGYSATNLQRASSSGVVRALVSGVYGLGNRLLAQPDAQGALPSLYAATAPEISGGQYFGPDGIFEMHGHPRRTAAAGRAYDPEIARRLWAVSEDLTGIRFDALG
jgi:NAD(P)-dependent dehydrogenase (short-subunit alcohol dehydrogenase family)